MSALLGVDGAVRSTKDSVSDGEGPKQSFSWRAGDAMRGGLEGSTDESTRGPLNAGGGDGRQDEDSAARDGRGGNDNVAEGSDE